LYPSLTDSATRLRHRESLRSRPDPDVEAEEDQVPWLLGIQMMLAVAASAEGDAAEIVAGTPEAIRKQWHQPMRRDQDSFPPPASLVIASLDGDARQQTWQNAARAVAAATRYTEPGGTIALWTAINRPPSRSIADWIDNASPHGLEPAAAEVRESHGDNDVELPHWDAAISVAETLSRVMNDFRLLIHADLESESIERLGLGFVASVDDLLRLARRGETCGILRAAHFAGSTFDAPLRLATVDRV
jgi:hypothetical protein